MELPYIDASILKEFKFQEGDVVVSVPIKCGTNWTMFIVYSIFTRCAPVDFEDLYDRVPWLELKWFQEQTLEERVKYLEQQVNYNTPGHRSFKSHLSVIEPEGISLPFVPEVKYIFTFRNPCDMILSLIPFFAGHSDEFFSRWGLDNPKDTLTDIDKLIGMLEDDEFPPFYFKHARQAWMLRSKPNVYLCHFKDLKNDLRKQVTNLTKFLDQDLDDSCIDRITERASFSWMKENEDKFGMEKIGFRDPDGKLIPPLQKGVLLRKGGLDDEAFLSPSQRDRIISATRRHLQDESLINFVLNGVSH